LETAAAAKKALLEKFQPKATVADPSFINREQRRATELEAVREARIAEREASLKARADAEAAQAAAIAAAEQELLEQKRLERKARKTAQKVDASVRRQDRRDALAAYTRPSANS
jgi:hypothetical protein